MFGFFAVPPYKPPQYDNSIRIADKDEKLDKKEFFSDVPKTDFTKVKPCATNKVVDFILKK